MIGPILRACGRRRRHPECRGDRKGCSRGPLTQVQPSAEACLLDGVEIFGGKHGARLKTLTEYAHAIGGFLVRRQNSGSFSPMKNYSASNRPGILQPINVASRSKGTTRIHAAYASTTAQPMELASVFAQGKSGASRVRSAWRRPLHLRVSAPPTMSQHTESSMRLRAKK
eukprot:scaffold4273_cov215-Pinguiococcus_pyrenoidosus.AAC.6